MGKAGSGQRDRTRSLGLKYLLTNYTAASDEYISSEAAVFFGK